ncbi:MAG: hypothetical protein CM15mP22_7970 [Gammaproteobacteria bacterium]|nr:MAG: hypothetical protein CM15mP22_7970 [Gammaproteobacteria bacterium]
MPIGHLSTILINPLLLHLFFKPFFSIHQLIKKFFGFLHSKCCYKNQRKNLFIITTLASSTILLVPFDTSININLQSNDSGILAMGFSAFPCIHPKKTLKIIFFNIFLSIKNISLGFDHLLVLTALGVTRFTPHYWHIHIQKNFGKNHLAQNPKN